MLDEFRSTSITWDKATRRIYSPITANASDSNGRKLNIQVVNSGQVENLTGATLHLYWETKDKAHDGLDAFDASDISRGEFEIFYTTGMLSNVGELNATLVLVDSTGKVVSDWFKITVTRGINEGAIQSENSFSSLTQALIDISNLESNYAPRLNDLTAQLAQKATQAALDVEKARINSFTTLAAGSTTGDAELIDARLGADGVTYTNTGGAIRGQFNKVSAQLAEKANTIPHQMIQFNVVRGLVNYVTATKTLEIPASYITLAGGTYKGIDAMSLVLPASNIFDIYYNGTTIVAQIGNSVPTGGTYYYLFSVSNANIPMISGLHNYSINGMAVNQMTHGVINTGKINYDSVSKTIVADITKLYVNGKAVTVNIKDTKAVTFGLTDTFYICLRYYDFALMATQNPNDIVVATISNGKVIYGENISINNAFKGNLTPLKDLNIWCFGDSLTKGVIEGTTTITESYPYNLNVLTDGAHINNFGVPGATAIDMLATIKTHTDFMANCDIAIIGIGTNGYLGGDFETSKDNEATQIGAYCAAIKYILENSKGKTKIVLLNPIKRKTTEGIPDRWLALMHWNTMRIANHFGVDCIDLYKMMPISPTDTLYYSADGVHLNARGYYRMARVIYDYLMANVSNCRATGIASPSFDY